MAAPPPLLAPCTLGLADVVGSGGRSFRSRRDFLASTWAILRFDRIPVSTDTPALATRIHFFCFTTGTWMAGTGPVMTAGKVRPLRKIFLVCFSVFRGRCGEVRIRKRHDAPPELLAQNTRPHLVGLAGREVSELKGAE
jgi:hypothetical protein